MIEWTRKNKTYYHLIYDDGESVKDLCFDNEGKAVNKFDELVEQGVKFIQLSKDSFNEYGWVEKHVLFLTHPKFAQGGHIENEIAYLDNRIYNLEQLREVASEDDIDYYCPSGPSAINA